MNNFYVYILKCSDDSYYVGHTDNIEQRISEHSLNKYNCYTSKRLPIEVAFVQAFGTRDEAFNAERKIKKWTRIKKEALIEENWEKVSFLAKKQFNNNVVED
jgi:predicted GIY-YIG superfamily endonuclease